MREQGNNNAYCHDSELTWIDWNLSPAQQQLLEFTSGLVAFRLSQPALRRRKYFQGRSIRGGDVKDVVWLAPDGQEMTDEVWNADVTRSLGVLSTTRSSGSACSTRRIRTRQNG